VKVNLFFEVLEERPTRDQLNHSGKAEGEAKGEAKILARLLDRRSGALRGDSQGPMRGARMGGSARALPPVLAILAGLNGRSDC
jgi:hypothetical protein